MVSSATYSDADILDKLATPAGSIRVTANDTYGAYGTGAKIELSGRFAAESKKRIITLNSVM